MWLPDEQPASSSVTRDIAYSVGDAVVWALILIVRAGLASSNLTNPRTVGSRRKRRPRPVLLLSGWQGSGPVAVLRQLRQWPGLATSRGGKAVLKAVVPEPLTGHGREHALLATARRRDPLRVIGKGNS